MEPRYRIRNTTKGLGQKGAAALEFAIVISLLVLITGGIIEFGRVFWYIDALTKATRDGARYLSTSALPLDVTLPLNTDKAEELVANAAMLAGLPEFNRDNVDIYCAPNCIAPEYVTVTIKDYSVKFGSWFAVPLPSGNWLLKPQTTMRYMCAERGNTC